MFNFTKSETNAVLFVVIVLSISGLYYLISPTKNLEPIYDYSGMDSTFKRLSMEKPPAETERSPQIKPLLEGERHQTEKQKLTQKHKIKKDKLLPASININTASEKELLKLPHIGPAKAKLIIEYRTRNEKFGSTDELLKIKGIGKKTLEKLKPYIKTD